MSKTLKIIFGLTFITAIGFFFPAKQILAYGMGFINVCGYGVTAPMDYSARVVCPPNPITEGACYLVDNDTNSFCSAYNGSVQRCVCSGITPNCDTGCQFIYASYSNPQQFTLGNSGCGTTVQIDTNYNSANARSYMTYYYGDCASTPQGKLTGNVYLTEYPTNHNPTVFSGCTYTVRGDIDAATDDGFNATDIQIFYKTPTSSYGSNSTTGDNTCSTGTCWARKNIADLYVCSNHDHVTKSWVAPATAGAYQFALNVADHCQDRGCDGSCSDCCKHGKQEWCAGTTMTAWRQSSPIVNLGFSTKCFSGTPSGEFIYPGYYRLDVNVQNLPAAIDWSQIPCVNGIKTRTVQTCTGTSTETQACACNSSTVVDNWVTPAVGASPTGAPAIPVKTISPSYSTAPASVTWTTTLAAGAGSPLNTVSCANGQTCNPTLSAKTTTTYGGDTLNVTTTPVSANACSSQPVCVVQRPFAPVSSNPVTLDGSNHATFNWIPGTAKGCIRDATCSSCSYDYLVEWGTSAGVYTSSSGWLLASPWDTERTSYTTSTPVCGTIYWRVRRGTGYSGVENWSPEYTFNTGLPCPPTSATAGFVYLTNDPANRNPTLLTGCSYNFTFEGNAAVHNGWNLTHIKGYLKPEGGVYSPFMEYNIADANACSNHAYPTSNWVPATVGSYWFAIDVADHCESNAYCNPIGLSCTNCCKHGGEYWCSGSTGSPWRCDPTNGKDRLHVTVTSPYTSSWSACINGFRTRTVQTCTGTTTETQACACNSSTVVDNWVTPAVGASPTNAPAIPVKTISPSYNTGSASVTWATTWLAGANSPLNAVSCANGSTCNPTLSAKDTSSYGSDTLNVTTTPVSANACSSQPVCVVQRPFAPTNGSVSVVGSNATFAWDTDKLVASYQFDTDSQALPIATYDFENASNRYLDTSGNGLTGASSGTPAPTFVVGSTAGTTAIQFVKTSTNALTVTNSLLKLNDYKYSFLFKLNSGYDSSWRQIFTIKSSGAAYPTERQPGVWFMPGSSSGNRNCFQIAQDNGTANPDYINCAGPTGLNSSFTVGTWYNFEVSRQGTTLTYSVDGTQRYTINTFSATMRSVTLPILYIGNSNPSGYASPDIAIDEFKIYSLAGIKDSSGSNTHLARSGSTLTDSSFVAGATGYGNAFRMTSGSVGGASLSTDLFKLNNFKYSFLFKLNAARDNTNWRQIFTVKAPSASYPQERQPGLWLMPGSSSAGTNNCFQVTRDNGTASPDVLDCVGPDGLNSSFTVGTWYRLEISRQGTVLTYSVKNADGTTRYTATAAVSAGTRSVTTPTLYIGNSNPSGYLPPDITIDDFKLWNTDNTLGKFGCVRDSICTACSYDYKVEWRGASESYTDVKSSGWLVASPWDSERVSFTTSSSSICGAIYWRVRRGTGYDGVENWSSEFGPFDTGISCPVTATINFSGSSRRVKVFSPSTAVFVTATATSPGSILGAVEVSGRLLPNNDFPTSGSLFQTAVSCVSGFACTPSNFGTLSEGNYYFKVNATSGSLTCNGSPYCTGFDNSGASCAASGSTCVVCSSVTDCDISKQDYVTAIVCPGNGGCGSPTTSGVVLGTATKSGQVLGASKVLGTSTEKGKVLGAATTYCTSGNNCDRVTDTQVATLKLPANIPWPSFYSACMDGKAKLQVSTDSNFVTAVFETPLYSRSVASNTLTYLSQSITGDLSNNYQFPLTYTGLSPAFDTTYYWRVIRYMNTSDADYDGVASGVRSFVVVPPVTISGSIYTNSTGTCPATSGTTLADTVTVNIGGVYNSFSDGSYSLSVPWSDMAQDVTVSGNGYSIVTCTVVPDQTKTFNLGVELNTSPYVQVSNGDFYAASYGLAEIPTGQSLLTAMTPSSNACGVGSTGDTSLQNVSPNKRVVVRCTDRHVAPTLPTSNSQINYYLTALAAACSSGCPLTITGQVTPIVTITNTATGLDATKIYVTGGNASLPSIPVSGGILVGGDLTLTGAVKAVVNPAIYVVDNLSSLPAVGISHTSWKELN